MSSKKNKKKTTNDLNKKMNIPAIGLPKSTISHIKVDMDYGTADVMLNINLSGEDLDQIRETTSIILENVTDVWNKWKEESKYKAILQCILYLIDVAEDMGSVMNLDGESKKKFVLSILEGVIKQYPVNPRVFGIKIPFVNTIIRKIILKIAGEVIDFLISTFNSAKVKLGKSIND